MPLYLYRCEQCNFELEKIQRFSDESLIKCPECNEKMIRVICSATLNFKGTGWYESDYKGK
jgi:putative FmdB family regulatory protein